MKIKECLEQCWVVAVDELCRKVEGRGEMRHASLNRKRVENEISPSGKQTTHTAHISTSLESLQYFLSGGEERSVYHIGAGDIDRPCDER